MTEISDAIRGPWVAVLSDQYGEETELGEFLDEGNFEFQPEIRVVRRAAVPVDGHLPASYTNDDLLYKIDDLDQVDDAAELAMCWEQARAVAAGLNIVAHTPAA